MIHIVNEIQFKMVYTSLGVGDIVFLNLGIYDKNNLQI